MSRFKNLGLVLGLLLSACGDDGGNKVDGDGAVDAGLFQLEPGGNGATGLAQPLSNAVRAGRITSADELISGVKVEGRVGDFKIYNDRIAIVIQDKRPSNGYMPYGGEILDVARVDGDNKTSLFGELGLGVGTLVMEPETVGVVKDGQDGEAIIRVIGTPAPVPIVESVIPGIGKSLELRMAMDYILKPGDESLEILIRMFNPRDVPQDAPAQIGVVLAGDGVDFFGEVGGFDVETIRRGDYMGMAGRDHTYAIWSADGDLTPLVVFTGAYLFSTDLGMLPPKEETQRRFYVAVGTGEPESVMGILRGLRGDAAVLEVSGTVRDASGNPVSGARVHVMNQDGDRYITGTMSAADGTYRLNVAKAGYQLQAWREDRIAADPVAVTVVDGAVTQDLELSDVGTVDFNVENASGEALPAKLVFARTGGMPAAPKQYGELRYPGGAAKVLHHVGGAGSVSLPPGDYSVTVSRGLEYDIYTESFTVEAGGTASIEASLDRVIDSTGYLCGDFHLHAMWSPDSSDRYDFKVRAIAAEGLEIAVTTEHEYIGDFNPTISELGLQKWVQGVTGEELTTIAYGHFNVFPADPNDEDPNRGALPWFGIPAPDLFEDVRNAFPMAVLQVNHPRSQPLSGYFSYVEYDPAQGTFLIPGEWSTNFDAIEVYNDSDFFDNATGTVTDWFALLDAGVIVSAAGNSDSHDAFGTEIGYPRNCFVSSTDEPAELSIVEFSQSVKGQRMTINGGAFITVDVGGKGLGDTVDGTSGSVSAAIKVQAPPWVTLDTLRVYTGGSLGGNIVQEIDISTPSDPVVRYEGTLELPFAQDNWFIVVAHGTDPMSPIVVGKRAFGATNPIFVDVDGNGTYDAPNTLQ